MEQPRVIAMEEESILESKPSHLDLGSFAIEDITLDSIP